MTYVNLVNEPAATVAQSFALIRDFICKRASGLYDFSISGIGWTLHDSSYAVDEDNISVNDWCVMKSAGENGLEQLYVYMKATSTSYIQLSGCLYWDNITHTEVVHYGLTTSTLDLLPVVALSIYGDMDRFHIFVDGGVSAFTGFTGGKYESVLDISIEICTTSLSAGVDVAINVADSTGELFAAGKYLFVYDNAGVERALIKTNDGVGNLTADLTNNYAIGATVRNVVPYLVNAYSSTWMALTANRVKELINIAGNINTNLLRITASIPTAAAADPGIQGNFLAAPFVQYSSGSDEGNILNFPELKRGILLTSISLKDLVYDPLTGTTWRYLLIYTYYIFVREV